MISQKTFRNDLLQAADEDVRLLHLWIKIYKRERDADRRIMILLKIATITPDFYKGT